MTVFWLILFFNYADVQPATPMHVGNFTTMDSCKAAATRATGIDTNPSGKITGFLFACVQANEKGTSPPN